MGQLPHGEGDPIAPAVVSDVDADANVDDIVAPDLPIFLPLDLDGIDDIDVAPVAPLRNIPADIGTENVQGAPDQGAPVQGVPDQGVPDQGALAAVETKEIEGVAYEIIDNEHDASGAAEGEIKEAPRYNLRQQQPPTFESYANPD